MCHFLQNSSFCGGVGAGACALSFLSKDFEILDFDPPNNPTSHYGACHFGYNLALSTYDFQGTRYKQGSILVVDAPCKNATFTR